jgi:hypothetical protein
MGIDALRRVLTAFSWRNPDIGYAQALNIISAVLLLYLREEDAFWLLCKFDVNVGVIVERMLPDQYTKTLVGSVVDQAVFASFVKVHLPGLHAHLNELQMDLSTFSVPWFLCLYLNSVSLHVAVKFLDNFFLGGPKFLFQIAMSVLKLNAPSLIERGKDDDIFVAVLKDFFSRLDVQESITSIDSENSSTDILTQTGRHLYFKLLKEALNFFGPIITTEELERQRMNSRLLIVHQMEISNRKNQIRTLCEQVSLSFDEVGVIYDTARRLEYVHGDIEEDPFGPAAKMAQIELEREIETRKFLISLGGWGIVRTYIPHIQKSTLKRLSLKDFEIIMKVACPFLSTSRNGKSTTENLPLTFTERIFFFCSFQYHFVNKQKKNNEELEFLVDLTAITHVLDVLLKQSSQGRLRFIFDLYDLNGDGVLDEAELKSLMDTFLDIFQNTSNALGKGKSEEEQYLRAVSAFLTAALKMGTKDSVNFSLSFNEFLLSIFSQSVFVEYFEKIWTIRANS